MIAGAAKLLIIFHQYEKHEAEAVGTDERTDLALLRIKTKTPKTFPTVKLATTTPRVGDWVVAVGNPFGLGGTVTAGIVSAHGRDIGSGPYDYMQIDAAVNKGNSGGPSFNLEGEVVGVNTAIFSPTGVNAGIAFALPASTVSDIIGQLKTHGKIERGWLGVRIQSVDEEMAASLGLSEPKGALVAEVQTPSPAATAGITRGDTILSVNGVRVNDSRDLSRQIFARKPDTFVELRLMRARKEQTLRVKLGVLPPLLPPTQLMDLSQLGLSVRPSQQEGQVGIEVTAVELGSPLVEMLRVGDVILEADNSPIRLVQDLVDAIRRAGSQRRRDMVLLVRFGNVTRHVTVPLQRR